MPEALRLQGIKKALHEVLSSEENSSCRAFCCALFFSEFREIGKRKQQFLRAVGGIGELNLRTGLSRLATLAIETITPSPNLV